ncbi:hypothetical protein KUTeg_019643 [Tegillarca granosa]|uniref:Uncharacterized protein n=1 Tax=Tegillarca granosa TaxID=220873 RepID=A0ABQ9ED77_TEGGR|nr:hypothetical protein KUTeg_019643 [Tegillarca granosa]
MVKENKTSSDKIHYKEVPTVNSNHSREEAEEENDGEEYGEEDKLNVENLPSVNESDIKTNFVRSGSKGKFQVIPAITVSGVESQYQEGDGDNSPEEN